MLAVWSRCNSGSTKTFTAVVERAQAERHLLAVSARSVVAAAHTAGVEALDHKIPRSEYLKQKTRSRPALKTAFSFFNIHARVLVSAVV